MANRVASMPATPYPLDLAEVIERSGGSVRATQLRLTDDVLDRIDMIVAPGVTINRADNGWASPALSPAARRR